MMKMPKAQVTEWRIAPGRDILRLISRGKRNNKSKESMAGVGA